MPPSLSHADATPSQQPFSAPHVFSSTLNPNAKPFISGERRSSRRDVELPPWSFLSSSSLESASEDPPLPSSGAVKSMSSLVQPSAASPLRRRSPQSRSSWTRLASSGHLADALSSARAPRQAALRPTSMMVRCSSHCSQPDADGWLLVVKKKKKMRWMRIDRSAPQSCPRLVPLDLVGRCFNCLAIDHVAAVCRSPARCLRCKEEGHQARCCKRPRSSPEAAGLGRVIIHRRLGGQSQRLAPHVSASFQLPSSRASDDIQGSRSWSWPKRTRCSSPDAAGLAGGGGLPECDMVQDVTFSGGDIAAPSEAASLRALIGASAGVMVGSILVPWSLHSTEWSKPRRRMPEGVAAAAESTVALQTAPLHIGSNGRMRHVLAEPVREPCRVEMSKEKIKSGSSLPALAPLDLLPQQDCDSVLSAPFDPMRIEFELKGALKGSSSTTVATPDAPFQRQDRDTEQMVFESSRLDAMVVKKSSTEVIGRADPVGDGANGPVLRDAACPTSSPPLHPRPECVSTGCLQAQKDSLMHHESSVHHNGCQKLKFKTLKSDLKVVRNMLTKK